MAKKGAVSTAKKVLDFGKDGEEKGKKGFEIVQQLETNVTTDEEKDVKIMNAAHSYKVAEKSLRDARSSLNMATSEAMMMQNMCVEVIHENVSSQNSSPINKKPTYRPSPKINIISPAKKKTTISFGTPVIISEILFIIIYIYLFL